MLAEMGNLGALASMSGGLSIKNPNDMQVALLKSRTVEDAMVARFHLAGGVPQALRLRAPQAMGKDDRG